MELAKLCLFGHLIRPCHAWYFFKQFIVCICLLSLVWQAPKVSPVEAVVPKAPPLAPLVA
jgi:hypothetical protein